MTPKAWHRRRIAASLAFGLGLALAGCVADAPSPSATRAQRPLSPELMALLDQKHMPKESAILIRLFKEESEMEIWKQDSTGRFALLKTYPICRWSGKLGPKIVQGDRQAPEGFYTITPAQMNPNSHYYLSFDIGYPNAYDRSYGRTGSDIMVHGDCSSAGCYAMTDEQIAEIYALARESFRGDQRSFQVQAYPFRMTPVNLARHRDDPNMPFWRMLKEGNDHFEVTRLQPKVDVCERRYVFDARIDVNYGNDGVGQPAWFANAAPGAPQKFVAEVRCPPYHVPQEIAAAASEKNRLDEIEVADLVRRGTPAAGARTDADGGSNSVFTSGLHTANGAPLD
jgi:murein L,D-transpeptidase YafK